MGNCKSQDSDEEIDLQMKFLKCTMCKVELNKVNQLLNPVLVYNKTSFQYVVFCQHCFGEIKPQEYSRH